MSVSNKLLVITVIAFIVCFSATYYYLFSNSAYGEINIEKARELIETKPSLVIVDVRTPEEYATGYIEGAINLCVECNTQLLLDNLNPNDEILLYCRTGRRSENAMTILNDNGYKKVYNMAGGILAWMDACYPTV